MSYIQKATKHHIYFKSLRQKLRRLQQFAPASKKAAMRYAEEDQLVSRSPQSSPALASGEVNQLQFDGEDLEPEDAPLLSSSTGRPRALNPNDPIQYSQLPTFPIDSRQRQPEPSPRVPLFMHACLSAYWFGWSLLWLPLFVVIIPKQVSDMSTEESKGSKLGTTLLLGSIASLFCAPVFGAMSDQSLHKMGRRRPFMIFGTAIASVALFVLAFTPPLSIFSLAFLALSVANNMIIAPCSALLPDIIPPDQRGIASGWIGGASMAGSMAGGIVSYFMDSTGVFGAYMILILIHALCAALTVAFIVEVPQKRSFGPRSFGGRMRSFVEPLLEHDFRVVFGTRFLFQMGVLTVQEYLQYYLADAIPAYRIFGTVLTDKPEKAVSILFIPVLFGSIFSSLGSGILSDRLGGRRKIILYVSAGMMSVSCVFFAVTRLYSLDMILGLVFGMGYGAFSVIDWAMATDVLPSERDFAKDMGIWSLALVLPQVIAAPTAGFIRDYFEKIGPNAHLGYSIVFLTAVGYFATGSYYIKYVEKVK